MATESRGPWGSVAWLVLLAALGGGAYFGANFWQQSREGYRQLEPVADCDLRRGPCAFDVGNARVRFAITPTDIPLMQTLTLAAGVENAEPSGVADEIRGTNMVMGLNRTVLQARGGGEWVGETILPLCSQRRMTWEALVIVDGLARGVPFATERP